MGMMTMRTALKRALASAALALPLLLAVSHPAGAAVRNLGAEVTVSELINFTVQDNGVAGLRFGAPYPGTVNNPEQAQGTASGAVTLLVGAETNVMVMVSVRADDFASDTHSIPISNARWNRGNDTGSATPMATTYGNVGTAGPGVSLDIWHWLSIPAGQAPGTYSTAFYYQGVAS